MSYFNQLNRYNIKFNDKIVKFSNPILEAFGVNHFFVYKLTNKGFYTCLGTHLPWMEYYFSEKLYLLNTFLRTPHNFSNGTFFVRNISDDAFQKTVDMGVKKFYLKLSLVFIEKIKEGLVGYGFAASTEKNIFESLALNEIPLLKLFGIKFREEFAGALNLMSENLVDLAALIGPSFYEESSIFKKEEIDMKKILKQFHLSEILNLSYREKEVLLFVSKGLSAPQIAQQLQLSSRTVEHYIENIKQKLLSDSKASLIQKANEFLSIGYSLP